MRRRASSLRETWARALREYGARLVSLVSLLNGDGHEQRRDHWNRLGPGLKGIDWKLPDWPNVFPVHAVHEQDRRTLLDLVHETRGYLRIFMDSWFAAGQNYAKWQAENQKLATLLNDAGRYVHITFQAAPSGGVQTGAVVETSVEQRTLYGAACTFGDFLRNPFRDVLAGQCKRCGRYFFNRKGYEQMVYCSQKCRWDAHNAQKEKSREQAHQNQRSTAIFALRKLLKTLEGSKAGGVPNKTWKDLIVSEVNRKHGTHFEAKWLTRAMNNPKRKDHKQFSRLQDAIERLLLEARG